MPKKVPVRENREFRNLVKTQGIRFAQVVNFLILKIRDIGIFAAKNLKVCFACDIFANF